MIGNMTSTDYLAMPVHLADPQPGSRRRPRRQCHERTPGGRRGRRPVNIVEITPPILDSPAGLDGEITKEGKFGIWSQCRHFQRARAA